MTITRLDRGRRRRREALHKERRTRHRIAAPRARLKERKYTRDVIQKRRGVVHKARDAIDTSIARVPPSSSSPFFPFFSRANKRRPHLPRLAARAFPYPDLIIKEAHAAHCACAEWGKRAHNLSAYCRRDGSAPRAPFILSNIPTPKRSRWRLRKRARCHFKTGATRPFQPLSSSRRDASDRFRDVPSVSCLRSSTAFHRYLLADLGPPPGLPSKTSRRTVTRQCLVFVCHVGISRQRARCAARSLPPSSTPPPSRGRASLGLDSRGFRVVCANFFPSLFSLLSPPPLLSRFYRAGGLRKLGLSPKSNLKDDP